MSFTFTCCRHAWYCFFLLLALFVLPGTVSAQYNFTPSGLKGIAIQNPTSLQFGPDGRLYVSQQSGIIKVFTIARNGANDYSVTATETIDLINKIPNHNDNGTLAPEVKVRQVTGLLVTGTAAQPIVYVSSSDSRIGGPDGDKNLDTNSGILSRLTWSGTDWTKLDLVRGLPRSEENHSVNGMQLDEASNRLLLAVGGSTNAGAPSTNFAYGTEYALAAAILSIDLTAIEQLPTQGAGNTAYKYDLPTVDDPSRENTASGSDINDPFGGNDGLNQAKIVPGGPVQVYASGFRNAYDLVITKTPGKAGRLYTIDNGGNQGWGGYPDQEGPAGTATNQYVLGEPGSTGPGVSDPQVNNLDNLHYIGQVATYVPGSHYGGHPNPIRANPGGAGLYTHDGTTGVWRTSKTGAYPLPADWPPVPLEAANPVEGDFQNPGEADAALLTFHSSTNGLTEYTASNFNNALQGTLLAAGFNGDIYKIMPTSDGTGVTNKLATWSNSKLNDEPSFASGFGSNPLDVTAQGDEDIFPGTVWAATYGAQGITVFEPQDMVVCSGEYSTALDDDGDGYSNADEIDSQADPCSGASKPADVDLDLLSDVNDADDDNDGLADEADAFALDSDNGMATQLPVKYELFNNDPGVGLFGLGFTGLMSNGHTNYKDQYDEGNLIAGGAVGAFSVVAVPEGDALGEGNNQLNAFQFGVNVNISQGPFTVHGRMVGPFFSNQVPQGHMAEGVYIGTGDQDNYVKATLNANGGQGGIEVVYEQAGVASTYQYPLAGTIPGTSLDIFLSVDPMLGTVQVKYAQDGGTINLLGEAIPVSGALLTAIQDQPALAVGVISTSRNGTAFTATWDFIRVTADPVTATGDWHTEEAVSGSATSRHENAYVQAGDKFYLIGGRGGGLPVQAYDPVTKTWEDRGSLPQELHHFQAVTLNGLIYVAGAFTGDYPHETPVPFIYVYNPATDKWSVGATIPEGRRRGAAGVVVHEGKLYLIGGIMDGHWDGHVAWLDAYEPATNTWSVLPDAPRPRDHFQAAIKDGKIYVAGGRRSSASTGQVTQLTVPEVDVYDLASGSWETLPASANIPTMRAGAATAVLGDELLVIGGESTQALAHQETEALNVKTNTWRQLSPLLEGRHATQAIVNNNGIYLAAGSGGQGGGPELSSQEVFFMFAPGPPVVSSLKASKLSLPASLSFEPTTTGESSEKTITLSNSEGNQDIMISSLQIEGSQAYAFQTPFPLPFTLAAGASLSISLVFSPLEGGSQESNLLVGHTGPGEVASIALHGNGVTTELSASSNSLHFFSQQAGTSSAPQVVTITNAGAVEKTIEEIILTGADSSAFGFSASTPIHLPAGAKTEVEVTFSPASLGTKVATLKILDAAGTSNLAISLTGEGVESAPEPLVAVYRLNAGGGEQSSSLGTFSADSYFSPDPGYVHTNGSGIAGTADDALYQTERSSQQDNGSFAYSLPVSNGQYRVVLHFAEIYFNQVGQRVFDVAAEGALVLDDYDIMAKAGANLTATSEAFSVEVADGELSLYFSALASEGGVNRPKVSAIEVLAEQELDNWPPVVAHPIPDQSATVGEIFSFTFVEGTFSDPEGDTLSYSSTLLGGEALPTWLNFSDSTRTFSGTPSGADAGVLSVLVKATDGKGGYVHDAFDLTIQPSTSELNAVRINAGGGQVVNALGTFSYDQFFTGGNTYTTSNQVEVAGAVDNAIYQSERYGSFSYSLPVASGTYRVRLHFAEIYFGAPGGGEGSAGKRVFDVTGEGQALLTNFDIYAEAGAMTALVKEFDVNVTDGTLDLAFAKVVENPKVSAIEVLASTGEPVNQAPLANAGADQTVTADSSGQAIVSLNGAGSSDVDGQLISYVWEEAGLQLATGISPTISLGVGMHTITLTVTDEDGATGSDSLIVTVDSSATSNQAPVADAGPDQQITLPANEVTLTGTGADPEDGSQVTFAWSQLSGPAAALFSDKASPSPTVSGLVAGSYVFSLVVADQKGLASQPDQVTVRVQEEASPPALAFYRLNAGGGEQVTSLGDFSADAYFSPAPGYPYTNMSGIAGTADDALYQTERSSQQDNGSFSYSLPLDSGRYRVVLHFAELYWNQAGQRVFDVAAEGALVLDDYDIVATIGANLTATSESFTVEVADGALSLFFSALASEGGVNRPKVSAIEVLADQGGNPVPVAYAGEDLEVTLPVSSITLTGSGSDQDGLIRSYSWQQVSGPGIATFSDKAMASPTVSGLVAGSYVFSLRVQDDQNAVSAPDLVQVTVHKDPSAPEALVAVYRLNAGGGEQSSSLGDFSADSYFSPAPGYVYSKGNGIAGTADDELYQTERSSQQDNGSFSYSLPLDSGRYRVVLHFAELYWNQVGQRVFDVAAEGALVLDDYDIMAKTGANLTATSEAFSVEVTDGELSLYFSALASEGGVNRPKVSAIEVLAEQDGNSLAVASVTNQRKGSPSASTGTISVMAYPNPFHTNLNLAIQAETAQEYTVKIFDLLGVEHYRGSFKQTSAKAEVHTLDLSTSALSRGLYLIVVEDVNKSFRKVIKVVKE